MCPQVATEAPQLAITEFAFNSGVGPGPHPVLLFGLGVGVMELQPLIPSALLALPTHSGYPPFTPSRNPTTLIRAFGLTL